MRFTTPLIVVKDMERSKSFYHDVLGLKMILNFGANITLTGGLSLQTLKSWLGFIHKNENEVAFGANASELYFEEENFDSFIAKLDGIPEIVYIHRAVEHSWGQRAVRFYDPDKHIIEVGESISSVIKRFRNQGLSVQDIAVRMDVPVDYVENNLK